MHVAQISFFVDPQRRAPTQLLEDWFSLADVARAAASAGPRITVIQASAIEDTITEPAVDYHFVAPDPGALLAKSAKFTQLLAHLRPDVLHVHGLCFPREVVALRALVPRTPILLQDHASRLPRFWRRGLFRRGMAQANAVSFCASDQADPFVRSGLLGSGTRILAVPESTSRFSPGDAAEARAISQVHGDPAVLWVGHLDRNKDPLTVLDAIEQVSAKLPGLRLWCCYGSDPLMAEVRARIDASAILRDRVHLLGKVSRQRVQELMRAADLFVLGSHHEGSGYSVIEALASGLPVAVTDIASFRSLVGVGAEAPGVLWSPGSSAGCAQALLALAARRGGELRAAARARFDAELSSAAVGRKLAAAYRSLQGSPA